MITDEHMKELGLIDERVDFYFKVENAVIDSKPFENAHEALLFMVLSRYCNGGKVAFPSLSKLADMCYCSKPTIIKCLKALTDKGFIKKVKRYDAENKSYSSNLYAVKNISEYKEVVKDVYQGSKGDLLEVVKDVYQGSKPGLHKEELIKEKQIKEQQTKKDEVVVDESLLKKAEEEAKKNPSVKNPEIYAKGMVENGWKPEEPKMNPKFDTRTESHVDITDPKVKDEYFGKKEELEISPEDEERALKILKKEGTYNFFMSNKGNKKLYINALKLALASS